MLLLWSSYFPPITGSEWDPFYEQIDPPIFQRIFEDDEEIIIAFQAHSMITYQDSSDE